MIFIKEPVDAIIAFAGGLYPETNLPNHLSISRLFQVEMFLEIHQSTFGKLPFVVFCGGQVNYHTGVHYPKPSSDIYRYFFKQPKLISNDLLLSTEKGICTVTEACGAKIEIEKHGWKTICLNTSKEHETRTRLISEKVFGSLTTIFNNPYNQPDGNFMNVAREEVLIKAFISYFDIYENGNIPYTDDKTFYDKNNRYYETQRSVIETSSTGNGMDSMAYLRKERK